MAKQKKRFNNKYNFSKDEIQHEKNDGISETIQNDSYTVAELLEKHAQGILPPIGRQAFYEENPDIDNPDPTLDPDFDIIDAKNQLDEISSSLTKKAKAEKALKEKALSETHDRSSEGKATSPSEASESVAKTQQATGSEPASEET